MRLTMLGGCGVWPAAGLACGGYLVEHAGFRVLIDPDALRAVMALDRPGTLDNAVTAREFHPGMSFAAGPFEIRTWPLPHWLPNAGLRLTADGESLAYTGDTGPSPNLVDLARDADVFLAEATYPREVPADSADYLSSAWQAGQTAARAGAKRLVLTHLAPGTDQRAALNAAAETYSGQISVATPAG